MTKITFIDPEGTARTVEAEAGATVMETAIRNDIPGIVAECGGACSCATCHVYVDPQWVEKLPPADAQEDGMLGCVLDRRPTSRLSCQIVLKPTLDGLTVEVAQEQI